MNLLFFILLLISIVTNIFLINLILKYRKINIANQQQIELIYQERSLSEKIERQQYQEKNYQTCLNKSLQLVLESQNLEQFYQQIIELISETLALSFSYLFKLVEEENKLVLCGGIGWKRKEIFEYEIIKNSEEINELFESETNLTVKKNLNLFHLDLINQSGINPTLLAAGINLIIKHPLNHKKIAILGLYTDNDSQFNQPEIDLIEQIKIIIEKKIILHSQTIQLQILERAINSSTNGIVITDATKAGNPIIYVNTGFEKITGYSAQFALGKNCRFLQRQDTSQSGIQEIREAIKNKTEISTVVKNYRKNGEIFWNEIYIAPVYDHQQHLTNFIGVQNDITEKYQIEQDLKHKTEQLENFSQKLKQINSFKKIYHENLELNIFYCLQEICQILEMEVGIVTELIGDKFIVISSYSITNKEFLIQGENHFINNLSKYIYKKNNSVYYSNVQNSELFLQYLNVNQLDFISYLATPITINNQIYGILHLFGQEKQTVDAVYQQDLIEAVVQPLNHLILNHEAELEKEQINIALKENQERLNSILSSLEDVIWSIHPQTLQLMYLNSSAENLYQCNLANFFQKRCFWLDFVHPEQQQQIREIYSNILNISLLEQNTNNHDLEYRIILPNGEEKYIRDRAYIIYDQEGNKVRIDGIITDITTRRKMQIALEKSEEEFRLLFELAPIAMMITNLEGKILQVNNSLCELLEYQPIQLIDDHENAISHPDDLEKNQIIRHKIVTESLEQHREEIRYLTRKGSIVYTIVHVTVLRNNQGQIMQLIQQIVDISQIKAMQEQIFYDALHDKLTGLGNHLLLTDRLEQSLKRCARHSDEICAVLVIDIDDFKQINDSMGHRIGDQLIKIIAEKIAICVSYKDTVTRISGDQFLVLLDDLKSEAEVTRIANQILSACNINNNIENHSIFSSVSIGITLSSIGYQKPEEMIRDADLTMHKAKQEGKNCYRIFNPTMHTKLLEKIKLETCLRAAINTPQFELYYQPIINLKTRNIIGFEALIRWLNHELGFISPANFIPIAEETNLIIPLGNWIFYTASQQINIWQQKYPDLSLFIAVNLSSKQLLDPHLLDNIDQILTQTNVNPAHLKIEITESILMQNFTQAKTILQAIQSRNLKISLDDFGTGYSSLSYLHQLPFNTLKVDRSFVQPLEEENNRTAIVEAIISLAHNLNLDVVAEGIETKIQEEILTNLACDYGQGYFYSKPIKAEEAEIFIDNFLTLN